MSSGGFCHVHCGRVHGRHRRGGGATRQNKEMNCTQSVSLFFTCALCPSVALCYLVHVGNWPQALRSSTGCCTRQPTKDVSQGALFKTLISPWVSTLVPPHSFWDQFSKTVLMPSSWRIIQLQSAFVKSEKSKTILSGRVSIWLDLVSIWIRNHLLSINNPIVQVMKNVSWTV